MLTSIQRLAFNPRFSLRHPNIRSAPRRQISQENLSDLNSLILQMKLILNNQETMLKFISETVNNPDAFVPRAVHDLQNRSLRETIRRNARYEMVIVRLLVDAEKKRNGLDANACLKIYATMLRHLQVGDDAAGVISDKVDIQATIHDMVCGHLDTPQVKFSNVLNDTVNRLSDTVLVDVDEVQQVLQRFPSLTPTRMAHKPHHSGDPHIVSLQVGAVSTNLVLAFIAVVRFAQLQYPVMRHFLDIEYLFPSGGRIRVSEISIVVPSAYLS
ncbi:hypothetical protein MKEN_00606700 [Mycena kentingensis (nom. inval.)]|nr:hypothetical protein MKEN_00606700 [Mycena kentingensis (nom. inval.)]